MADPWTSAWEEAEATARPDVTIFSTLELQHPAFLATDGVTNIPIRVVTDTADDQVFGIEAGAKFNGGSTDTFKAIPFHADRPEFAEGKMPECAVTIDNVGREVAQYLEAAVAVKADLVAIYREYRSDDMTAPCYGPVEFLMRNVVVKGTDVTGTARLDDLANRKFPFKIYSIDEFPGLQDKA